MMLTITMKLFGAFHQYSSANQLTLTVPAGCDLKQLRQALTAKIQEEHDDPTIGDLINCSAITDEKQILMGDIHFQEDAVLAILPPVCGG